VGYCAASNKLDLGALILFAILVLWQMPHFFSIAVYRIADYTAASIPVLPITRGIRTTKIRSILYILAFIGVASLLTLFRYTGPLYLIAAAALGLTWLLLALKGFRVKNDNLWARRMFRTSLLVITVLSVMISLDTV
jgi:protoheme IX farnesyltransferase